MLRTLLTLGAGIAIGHWLAQRQGAGSPDWWTDTMTRSFAADQVLTDRTPEASLVSQVAAAAEIPAQWLMVAVKAGATDLQAAAQRMVATGMAMGRPSDSLPDTLDAWRHRVITAGIGKDPR